jgi:hypothetical protein
MLTLKPVYALPVRSSRFDDVDYCHDILYYNYVRDGVARSGGIRFARVPAYRFRTERCVRHWEHDARDVLSEVEDSEWVREIRADTDESYRDTYGMHHYMINLTHAGTFEIIAESWEALPDEEGEWPDISAD